MKLKAQSPCRADSLNDSLGTCPEVNLDRVTTVLPGMSTQAFTASHAPASGLLGWLGFGRNPRQDAEEFPKERAAQHLDATLQARRRLLDQMADFLLSHRLEITPANLVTAHGIYAGLNPGLRRKIDRLLQDGHKLTQAWLDQATANDGTDSDSSVRQLIDKLEEGIAEFSRSTSSARSATRNYGDALAQHVDRLEAEPDAGSIIAELAQYARAMLERSRKAEAELRQAEQEAASLRRKLDRARRDAEIDYLTGLPNRRSFEAVFGQQIAEARENGEQLCVAFCDIDRFKAVNDTHGHEAGDRIICVVAKTLAQISGDRCHLARHGGEEFVLLFRGVSQEEAFEQLDRARAELASRKLINRRTEKPFGQVTFSGGIADVFAYPDPRLALAAADEALYAAKESGRNRIVLARQDG